MKKAIALPRKLDLNLVESGLARSCLDKLIEKKCSPLVRNIGVKSFALVPSTVLHLRELDRKNHPMIRHYSKRYQRTTSQDQASLLVLDLISVEPELQTYPFLWA